MRRIVHKSQFKKDFKRLRSAGRNISVLADTILKLQQGESLPEAMRDHLLSSNWKDHRECHLSGDWLLIYQLTDTELVLVRTGSHNELF